MAVLNRNPCRPNAIVLRQLVLLLSCIFLLPTPARTEIDIHRLHLVDTPIAVTDTTCWNPSPPLLAVQVDLDYVFDPELEQQEKNLTLLVERVCSLGVTAVLLQAFADPDGNGVADALYFPNRFLPVKRDLFPKAAARIKQCGVAAYAWMPMLAFSPPGNKEELAVMALTSGQTSRSRNAYYRLSPFNPKAINIIQGIYEDLAQSGPLDGILFHDDGMLSDFEDASPAALLSYRKAGFTAPLDRIRKDERLLSEWSRFKTKHLITFSHALLDIVRKRQPNIRSARNLYARTILESESEQWLGQSLPLFLQAYDYTVIMAMPHMEKAQDAENWLSTLGGTSLAQAMNPASVVFELQTFDWWQKKQITMTEFTDQLALLQQKGAVSFAYYPDDFIKNHPDAGIIRQQFSQIRARWSTSKHD